MDLYMKDSGLKIECKVKEDSSILMEIIMKENFSQINNMDKVIYIIIKSLEQYITLKLYQIKVNMLLEMELYLKDNGATTNKMEKE